MGTGAGGVGGGAIVLATASRVEAAPGDSALLIAGTGFRVAGACTTPDAGGASASSGAAGTARPATLVDGSSGTATELGAAGPAGAGEIAASVVIGGSAAADCSAAAGGAAAWAAGGSGAVAGAGSGSAAGAGNDRLRSRRGRNSESGGAVVVRPGEADAGAAADTSAAAESGNVEPASGVCPPGGSTGTEAREIRPVGALPGRACAVRVRGVVGRSRIATACTTRGGGPVSSNAPEAPSATGTDAGSPSNSCSAGGGAASSVVL
ncbi:MAG: hypothetical protein ACJ77E_03490 [Gaiellaceae bacterium]